MEKQSGITKDLSKYLRQKFLTNFCRHRRKKITKFEAQCGYCKNFGSEEWVCTYCGRQHKIRKLYQREIKRWWRK